MRSDHFNLAIIMVFNDVSAGGGIKNIISFLRRFFRQSNEEVIAKSFIRIPRTFFNDNSSILLEFYPGIATILFSLLLYCIAKARKKENPEIYRIVKKSLIVSTPLSIIAGFSIHLF